MKILYYIECWITYLTLYAVFFLTLVKGIDTQDIPTWKIILFTLASSISAYWICRKINNIEEPKQKGDKK